MVKYYFYFPEEDNEVLKSDGDSIKRVFEISKLLKGKSEVYYDEANVETFGQKNKILGVYLDDGIDQLRYILFKLNAKSILTNPLVKNDCVYVQWNLDKMPEVGYSKRVIAELAERSFQFPDERLLLINLDDAIDTCREKVLVFKDAKHLTELPSAFAKIDFVIDANELELWQNTHDKAAFTLLDRARFQRTRMVHDGKPVFQETATGKYWYMDNFHKNEYEVFNSNKEHIAVADLEGNEDPGKKVNGRVF